MIIDEIRTYFAFGSNGIYRLSSVSDDYLAWVILYGDGTYGVMVPYDGPTVNESFANAKLYSDEYSIDDSNVKCLVMTSSIERSRNEFAIFCTSFVDPGKNGSERKKIVSAPVEWWKRWKTLIGNSISEKMPYAVLGEMLMFNYFLSKGEKALWGGPSSASHDIVSEVADYEVKSTLSKSEEIVHISSPFQLQRSSKRLFLYYCKFEENMNGISINDCVERLVLNGSLRDEINTKLDRLGYSIGNSARDQKYIVHEINEYEVDDDFPQITPADFKDGKMPVGVKHLSYDVDLGLLNGKSVEITL